MEVWYIENKYSRWYFSIIKKYGILHVPNLSRYLSKKKQLWSIEESKEWISHHSKPKALGGENGFPNEVFIKEDIHILLHWLLTKMVIGKALRGMKYAFARSCKTQQGKVKARRHIARARRLLREANEERGGIPHTEETKAKISAGNKGQRRSEESRARMSASAKLRESKRVYTDEDRAKMSVRNKGRKLSEEHKNKIRVASTGRKHTEESRAKMSILAKTRPPASAETISKMVATLKARGCSDEQRARLLQMAENNKGKKLSDEHRNAISEGRKGMKFSDEHKANISAVMLGKKRGPYKSKAYY